jgi:hypothetical protein
MCLEQVERKVKSDLYETAEDFEYDVNLIFRNCEAYNAPKKSEHMVALGKYGSKAFRKLFLQRMKAYENPESVVEKKREVSPSNTSEQPQKKVKIEATAAQAAPRTVISAAPTTITSSTSARAKSISPKLPSSISNKPKIAAISNLKPNQPVPLHVAIAQVKERFPLRRPYKLLEDWEGSRQHGQSSSFMFQFQSYFPS